MGAALLGAREQLAGRVPPVPRRDSTQWLFGGQTKSPKVGRNSGSASARRICSVARGPDLEPSCGAAAAGHGSSLPSARAPMPGFPSTSSCRAASQSCVVGGLLLVWTLSLCPSLPIAQCLLRSRACCEGALQTEMLQLVWTQPSGDGLCGVVSPSTPLSSWRHSSTILAGVRGDLVGVLDTTAISRGRSPSRARSGIDHVWCKAPTAFLLARGASAWVEASVFSDRIVSDHVGLGFRSSLPRQARRRATAKEAMIDEVAGPVERLEGVTARICAAAKSIEQMSRATAEAVAPEWRAHWPAAWRAVCLRRDRRAFLGAVARVHAHVDLFYVALLRVRLEAAYAEALQALIHERFPADQRRDLRVASDEFERRVVRRRYGSLLAASSPRRRTISCTAVLDAEGPVIGLDVGAADALPAHWGPSFTSAGVVGSVAMERLRDHVVAKGAEVEVVSLGELRRVLARAPRSAPGLDGITYEHSLGSSLRAPSTGRTSPFSAVPRPRVDSTTGSWPSYRKLPCSRARTSTAQCLRTFVSLLLNGMCARIGERAPNTAV